MGRPFEGRPSCCSGLDRLRLAGQLLFETSGHDLWLSRPLIAPSETSCGGPSKPGGDSSGVGAVHPSLLTFGAEFVLPVRSQLIHMPTLFRQSGMFEALGGTQPMPSSVSKDQYRDKQQD